MITSAAPWAMSCKSGSRLTRMPASPSDPDAYIAALPDEARPIVEQVRAAIRTALPDAEERVRYGMPAVALGGTRYHLHYAGWKAHVGLYPVSTLSPELEAEVAPYRSKTDSVTFPYAKPVPYALITRIARELGAMRRE